MSNLAFVGVTLAAATSVVIVLIGRHHYQPRVFVSAPIEQPAAPKADRLPVEDQKLFELPELRNLPGTAEGRTQDAAIPGATRESKDAVPTTVVRAVGAASTKLDPVCGARGRTWYTRDNGWKYWRCVR